MKKLLFLLTVIFCSSTLSAQGLDLGIKAGANFATLSDATNAEQKTGFQAGFFAGVKFSDKLGIQADLLYSQQGAEFDSEEFN